jgi:L-rhamnose isomerase
MGEGFLMTAVLDQAFALAVERYAEFGVDVDHALETLSRVSLSLHCWQGDDVGGFESPDTAPGSGLQVTGRYPGEARTLEELRADLGQAYALIPGRHRLNLHAIYGDFGRKRVPRDQIAPGHFQSWIDWARARGLGLDFNATLFGHPLADSGYTLAHRDGEIRRFWIEHVKRCREIGAWMGGELGTACGHNLWIPDGSKDQPIDRAARRLLLRDSLDEIFDARFPRDRLRDSVESKLFGIGSESFVVGSHEFYLAWALQRGVTICLDMGHYHPTESVADKITALLPFFDELLIHVSRGVRWDSDHVVVQNDELTALMQEVVRAGALPRVRLALDFFDAELNRVGAWAIGARATLRALLFALLEPIERLRACEEAGDFFGRLTLLEEAKALPFGAVWDRYCRDRGAPVGGELLTVVRDYEKSVLPARQR